MLSFLLCLPLQARGLVLEPVVGLGEIPRRVGVKEVFKVFLSAVVDLSRSFPLVEGLCGLIGESSWLVKMDG